MSACARCCTDTGLIIKDLFTPPFTRQKLYILAGAFFVFVLIIIIVVATIPSESSPKPPTVHRAVLGRCSLPKVIKDQEKGLLQNFKFENYTKGTSLEQLRKGKVAGMVWSVSPPCESQLKDSLGQTMEGVQMVREIIKHYSSGLKVFKEGKDLDKSTDEKITSIIAINGGHSIDSRLRVLEPLALLGVRVLALASECDTPWITSTSSKNDKPIETIGNFTKNVLNELKRVGILVDLTGTSKALQKAILKTFKYPMVYTASNSVETMNSTNNIDEETLKLLKENRGLVMVSFRNSNLCKVNCTIDNVVDALAHLKSTVGVDCVGLGGDFDVDNAEYPVDMKSPSGMVMLAKKLKEKKWTDNDIDKVFRANFQRVLLDAEKTANLDGPGFEMYEPKQDFATVNTSCYTDFDKRYTS